MQITHSSVALTKVLLAMLLFAMVDPRPALGQATVVRESAEAVFASLAKYFGKSSTKELAEQLAEHGGETAVRALAKKAAAEGGEKAVDSLARLAGKYGPETVRALNQADNLAPVLRSLDELPEESIAVALQRLGSARGGRELAENVSRFGTRAIQAELTHPGVGTSIIRSLGDDGLRLAEKLNSDQVIQFARHAEDIAKLAPAQRTGVLHLFETQTQRMLQFTGRFVENNPGKILFASASTAILLAESERFLGGDEIVFDAEGVPHLFSKSGVVGKAMESASQSIIRPMMSYLIPIVALAVFAWFAIKLGFMYKKARES